eukprot:COSAG02_NODE_10567_length_1911_cov_85.550773_2_plen_201_part_00
MWALGMPLGTVMKIIQATKIVSSMLQNKTMQAWAANSPSPATKRTTMPPRALPWRYRVSGGRYPCLGHQLQPIPIVSKVCRVVKSCFLLPNANLGTPTTGLSGRRRIGRIGSEENARADYGELGHRHCHGMAAGSRRRPPVIQTMIQRTSSRESASNTLALRAPAAGSLASLRPEIVARARVRAASGSCCPRRGRSSSQW